jgi:hypothetical protein
MYITLSLMIGQHWPLSPGTIGQAKSGGRDKHFEDRDHILAEIVNRTFAPVAPQGQPRVS